MPIHIRILNNGPHRFLVRATRPENGHAIELSDLTWSEALDHVDRLAHEEAFDVRAIYSDGVVRLTKQRRG